LREEFPRVRVVLDHDRAVILHGDSVQLDLPENSVDAVVTDPPAGVGFMGKQWDKDRGGRDAWVAWLARVLAPSIRALKPGGHGLVWALPRTSHWTALALEEAGFEIRDRVSHLFGTGFPKSLTSASAEIPAGAGTALKPAVEDWWLVKKPHSGMSVAECFAKHGTGVLWIDACRTQTSGETFRAPQSNPANRSHDQAVQPGASGSVEKMHAAQIASTARLAQLGRWPAHLVLDEEAAEVLDEQSGDRRTGGREGLAGVTLGYHGGASGYEARPIAPTGGASRFFYVAKGSRAEKDAGLDHLPKKTGGEATGREDGSAGVSNPRAGAGRTGGARNQHPTVKSIALMRWLCRLVAPPGGVVLDPFAGSGSTGVAALAEGLSFVGCEMTEEYLPILEGRIRHALERAPDLER
jgi:DNA methylase